MSQRFLPPPPKKAHILNPQGKYSLGRLIEMGAKEMREQSQHFP